MTHLIYGEGYYKLRNLDWNRPQFFYFFQIVTKKKARKKINPFTPFPQQLFLAFENEI